MKHYTTSKYWRHYHSLTREIQLFADKNFQLLKKDPRHPSLNFKQIGRFYSVRVGLDHRALGVESPDKSGIIWFWIGDHDQYDKLLKSAQ